MTPRQAPETPQDGPEPDPALKAAFAADAADERRYRLWAALFDEDEGEAFNLRCGAASEGYSAPRCGKR